MKTTIYSISAHLPFARTLAQWVLRNYGDNPLMLSRVLILLPSRRACESLREAFLRESSGAPLLLPKIRPLDDTEGDLMLGVPTAVQMPATPAFEIKRLFILARLIHRYQEQVKGTRQRFDHALRLAREFGLLLDDIEREQVALGNLESLVPDMFAEHWQLTVGFLQLLSAHWPHIVKEEQLISPAHYRNQLLGALTRQWKDFPPDYPVIAAGTTGSIPATAALLSVIAGLPQGAVILPGLDRDADDEYFSDVGESHPQWGMKQLLAKLGCPRKTVALIGEPATAREKLLCEVMRPPESSGNWRQLMLDMSAATQGMHYVPCADPHEEASVIALMLRDVLRTPHKTAALITPDRDLARRVAAAMKRFDVQIDDSAGMPLMQTPAATFLRLVLDVALNRAAPVPLLSLLKHPLAHAGMERIASLEAAREIELRLLRGIRRNEGVAGLAREASQLKNISPEATLLLGRLQEAFAPLDALFAQGSEEIPIADLLAAHLQCAQSLAGDTLWEGPEADALGEFITELGEESAGYAAPSSAYPAIFETLLSDKVYRPEYGMHPRLKILSPIGARMQSFDKVILGGLNESVWPPDLTADPWFNRSMRAALGLPAPEQQIGLSAHDFMMLASAPEVALTRAEKSGGASTTPSRWLVKMKVVLATHSAERLLSDVKWNRWAASLDASARVTSIAPPAPAPPLAARPHDFSVTQIEMLMRDPYALYASHILKLRALRPLAQEPQGAEFGNAVHEALERFVKAFPQTLPDDACEQLLRLGRQAMAPLFFSPLVEALWWPRFVRIAQFVLEEERRRRPHLQSVQAELDGKCRLDTLSLHGRIDRLERGRDGSLAIIDYKTGGVPGMKDIGQGLSNQLVLLAIIMGQGGADMGNVTLEYWHLRGGEDAGKIKPFEESKIAGYIETAKEGLRRLMEIYGDPSFPYLSTPIASRAMRYSDYEHLARVQEWS